MNIACIKNNIVTNVLVFETLEMAQEFLTNGWIPDTDLIAEINVPFGIGDNYIDGEFSKYNIT
jgi:hypothetical protein